MTVKIDDAQEALDRYVDALRILTLPAYEQCDEIGWYNVAWELKDEALAVEYYLGNASFDFSPRQRERIAALNVVLHTISSSITRQATTATENVTAMEDDSRVEARRLASTVLALF